MKSNYSHTNGTVMIVDDTPGNLALLSDTLSEAGYRVLVATDGQSALEQIAYLKPDVILLDVMMPGIDGIETCNRLKSDPDTAHIPVLFMTALSELNNLLRGFGEGAVDYLVKPIRPPEVLARVDVQLTQARNLQRVANALNNSPFSALAINSSGNITWSSPGGSRWLEEFLQKHALSGICKIGSPLPKPILEWVKQRLSGAERAGSRYFCESFFGHPCPTSGKNYATANAFGCPSRPASLVTYPTRGMQHSYAMTRRDVGKPAFSLRKKRFVKTHALSLLGTTRLLSRSE